MDSSVNSHTNATRIGWHLWEIDLRFAPGLPPGWSYQPLGDGGLFRLGGHARAVLFDEGVGEELRGRGAERGLYGLWFMV